MDDAPSSFLDDLLVRHCLILVLSLASRVVRKFVFYQSLLCKGASFLCEQHRSQARESGSMIYSQLSSDLWAVRLEDGDDILVSLRRFVEVKGVRAGLLEGIGSLRKVRLGYYDFETRKYSWQVFEEDMEILNLSGNVSTKDAGYIPHVHVALGRKDFSVLGGHLDDGSQANMVEVFVRRLPGELVKVHDQKIGLNVLQLSDRI